MDGPTLVGMFLKLVVAALLGGLIGIERETHGRPAGLRTHVLVCVGSTLFTLCSGTIAGSRFDPGRITAQIVTGMGFLGAGTIMRQGSVVRGLTTAASMWTVAAIGIAVAIGGDMLAVACIATLLVVVTLNLVPHLERVLVRGRAERIMTIVTRKDREKVCAVLGILVQHSARVTVLGMEEGDEPNTQLLRIRLRETRDFDEAKFAAELASSESVISYSWE